MKPFPTIYIVLILSICAALGSSKSLLDSLDLPTSSTNGSYNIHAVLVAGSNGFDNYRHQADVCHAYQVLRAHGVPEENIIVMMYDDIAYHEKNPNPGVIINVPYGPNVYQGVSKDYTGYDVNPENFMKILKGDQELAASGKKVLQSGPDDHVFIYYSDHGSVGIIGFIDDVLTSQELFETLTYMNQNGLYGKLTFYLEACESGSMFANLLPSNMNIYATTASAPDEESYATNCYYDQVYSCLADEFSVAWILDSEGNVLNSETLETQFEHVTKVVEMSSPQQYGDKNLANLAVGEFQGENQQSVEAFVRHTEISGKVNSRDVPLFNLKRQLTANNDPNETAALQSRLNNLTEGRRFYDRAIRSVLSELCEAGYCSAVGDILSTKLPLYDHKSYSLIVRNFSSNCINLGVHSYTLAYMYTFANIVQLYEFDQLSLERFNLQLEQSCLNHIIGYGFEAIV